MDVSVAISGLTIIFTPGPQAFAKAGPEAVKTAVSDLLDSHLLKAPRKGHVAFVGVGPGDPDLLTLRARQILDRADVVLHDRLVTPEILELARREALIIDVGKPALALRHHKMTLIQCSVSTPSKGRKWCA